MHPLSSCCIHILVLYTEKRSLTNSRKSIRPSASKKNVSLCRSNWYSASTTVIRSARSSTLRRQTRRSSSSSSLFAMRRSTSSRVAGRSMRLRSAALGEGDPAPPPPPPESVSPSLDETGGGRNLPRASYLSAGTLPTTIPRSSPRSASTLTYDPTLSGSLSPLPTPPACAAACAAANWGPRTKLCWVRLNLTLYTTLGASSPLRFCRPLAAPGEEKGEEACEGGKWA
mmetsp:Transcript_16801/g.48395  ORF Transcript_16801/g.48395 Transcript_16801/m.48395 type:complete len:228 (+) Transcript_16801:756-1439(+)